MSLRVQNATTIDSLDPDCRDILEHAPIGIFKTTPEGRLLYANRALAEMFGHASPQDLIDSVQDISAELFADPNVGMEIKRRLATEGVVKNYECEQKRKDGSRFWASGSIRTVHAENGGVSHYQGFVADITHRKEIEETLRKGESLFRKVFDILPVGLWIADQDGKLVQGNPAAKRIWGAEPLVGPEEYGVFKARRLPSGEKVAPGDWALGHTLNKGVTIADELLEIEAFDGKNRTILNYTAPVKDNGALLGAVVVNQDVTALYEAEQRLIREKSILRDIFEDTLAGYWDWDLRTNQEYLSPTFKRMFGYEDHELPNSPETWQRLVMPEDLTRVMETFEQHVASRGRVPFHNEVRYRHKDGSIVWVICAGRVIEWDQQGRPLRMVGCHIDITKQKQMEQAIAQARQEAEAASNAKSVFLANMSHELRTPFNGIMGMLQLLQTTSLDKEQQEYISIALKAADRYTQLLTDLLDIARIETGQLALREDEFSLKDTCDSVSELFLVNAAKQSVSLECSIDPALPARLMGDESRIRQILFNLVGNALKFTEKGSVKVELLPLAPGKDGNPRVMFSVSDTGIGISDEQLKNLFRPFSQADGSYTRKYQGAGLGLAIVKRLVDLMHGSIVVESEVGQGTSVHIVLPFKQPVAAKIPELAQDGPHQKCTDRHCLRILFAEDEPSNQIAMILLLRKAGHHATLAENGKQVLDLLKTGDFDVILMDVQMPVMDGVQATRAIRSSVDLGPKKDIPIIALTAHAMKGDKEEFLAAGMDDYLAKPVRMEDLRDALGRCMSVNRPLSKETAIA